MAHTLCKHARGLQQAHSKRGGNACPYLEACLGPGCTAPHDAHGGGLFFATSSCRAQANMVALVAAILITLALSAPLSVTLEGTSRHRRVAPLASPPPKHTSSAPSSRRGRPLPPAAAAVANLRVRPALSPKAATPDRASTTRRLRARASRLAQISTITAESLPAQRARSWPNTASATGRRVCTLANVSWGQGKDAALHAATTHSFMCALHVALSVT